MITMEEHIVRTIAKTAQNIAANQSQVARDALGLKFIDQPWVCVKTMQEQASRAYLVARIAAGVES